MEKDAFFAPNNFKNFLKPVFWDYIFFLDTVGDALTVDIWLQRLPFLEVSIYWELQ